MKEDCETVIEEKTLQYEQRRQCLRNKCITIDNNIKFILQIF